MGIIKKIFAVASFLSFIVIFSAYFLGYYGERSFSGGQELPEVSQTIESARKLIGTPYDPFMGQHNNLGAKLGFIVCSDVPNIAYGIAGYSLQGALKRDFERNPSAYNSSDGNNPINPYFHRRARNLYVYFKSTGNLKGKTYVPNVGDLVFYRKNLNGYIAHVALVAETSDGGYTLVESAPKTLVAQEVDSESPINRGWILAGFGVMYH